MLYSFEDFSLDTARRELRRGGALIALQPQVFDLLEFAIRNRERVVSKDDLLAAVWNGRIVSESTSSTRINAARNAIADNGEEQRLLRTAHGKGIRFVGTVHEEAETVRKLAAILAADVGGGGRLMGQAEVGPANFSEQAKARDDRPTRPISAERRQLTVMSCNLADSTALRRKLMRYIRQYNKAPRTIKWRYRDPTRRITLDSLVTVH